MNEVSKTGLQQALEQLQFKLVDGCYVREITKSQQTVTMVRNGVQTAQRIQTNFKFKITELESAQFLDSDEELYNLYFEMFMNDELTMECQWVVYKDEDFINLITNTFN